MGKRFRERAKPLVDQTRDLWQRIQQTQDPVTRTLKEPAYMQLFRPMWEDSINEQYYIDYPHRRPDPEVENRKVQERLANVPPVILQAAYDKVRKEEQGPLVLLEDERGRNGANRQVPEPGKTHATFDKVRKMTENADSEKERPKAAEEEGKTSPVPQKSDDAKPTQQPSGKAVPDAEKSPTKTTKTVGNSGESGMIKADKTIAGHAGTPKTSEPNTVIDHIGKDGSVNVRSFYGVDGMKSKDIHTDDHGYPKQHPYGKHGEHAHDYEWDDDGRLKNKATREITDEERERNGDIL